MGLPVITLPTYTLKLPSDGKQITYRPFMVREEKVLLLAMQEDGDNIVDAIKKVISECTFNKLDVDMLPQVDLEYVFINIRNKSMGEGFDVHHKCLECGATNTLSLDLSKVYVKRSTEEVEPVIKIRDDMWVTMRYPTFDAMFELSKAPENVDVNLSVLASCVTALVHGDTKYNMMDYTQKEVVDFIEQFSKEELSMMEKFFESAPKLAFDTTYKCAKCGEENQISLSGVDDFFV